MRLKNNIIWFFVSVFIVLFFHVESFSQTRINDVRWGFHENYVKLVFEFSSPVKFDFHKQPNLRFKFNDCSFGSYSKRKISVDNLILKNIMLEKSGGNLLAKINTRDSYKFKSPYVIENPYRVVIDFYYEKQQGDNYAKAIQYEKKGDYETALDFYRKAVRQNPKDYDSYFRAGILRYKRGDLDKAVINFQQVPENSPHWEKASEYISKITGTSESDNPDSKTDVKVKKETSKIDKKEKPENETLTGLKKPEKEVNSFIDLNSDSDNLKGKFSSLVDFGKYYLYLFIGISIIFLFLLFLLIRKYLRLKKEQKLYESARKKTEVPETEAKNQESSEKRVDFTRKLLEVYQATEASKQRLHQVKPAAKKREKSNNDKYKSWNKKIDNILKYENESIKLTKKFREKGNNGYSGGKYDAVYELMDKNWDIKDIARELNMGMEEVKLAVNMRHEKKENMLDKNHESIYRLADLKVPVSEIAQRLNIGQEEVKLAIELRDKMLNR